MDVQQALKTVRDESGFVVLPDHFDPAPLVRIMDDLLSTPGHKEVSGGLRPGVLQFPEYQALFLDPWLLELAEGLIGSRPSLGSIGSNVVMPGSVGMPAHQDYPYFAARRGPLPGEAALCVQMIWYLCDVEPDMGTTFVIPCTQLLSGRPGLDDMGRVECVEARAGTLFVGHGALWHGVLPNTGQKPRPAVLGSYVPYWVRPMFRAHVPPGLVPGMDVLMCGDFGARVGEDYDRVTKAGEGT